jgi:hypothetical protein
VANRRTPAACGRVPARRLAGFYCQPSRRQTLPRACSASVCIWSGSR